MQHNIFYSALHIVWCFHFEKLSTYYLHFPERVCLSPMMVAKEADYILSNSQTTCTVNYLYITCFDLMLTTIISVNWNNHEMKPIWLWHHLLILLIIFIVTVHVQNAAQQDVCPPWFILVHPRQQLK